MKLFRSSVACLEFQRNRLKVFRDPSGGSGMIGFKGSLAGLDFACASLRDDAQKAVCIGGFLLGS